MGSGAARASHLSAVHVERPHRHAVLAVDGREERRERLRLVVVRQHVPPGLVEVGRADRLRVRRVAEHRHIRRHARHEDRHHAEHHRRAERAGGDLLHRALLARAELTQEDLILWGRADRESQRTRPSDQFTKGNRT